MNRFLFENLGDILRPELIETASEMDKKREEQLNEEKKQIERLKDYNLKVATLNALIQRSGTKPPTEFDVQGVELCIKYFHTGEEVINKEVPKVE